MKPRIILDLCAGTGAWSKPYRDAGYDVRLVTLPDHDARLYQAPENVHGILAAPPCTHLAGSGARWWAGKGQAALLDALSVVDACLRIVLTARPAWWCLENPVGRLPRYIGKPRCYFQPWHYGDPYTKKTALWGYFRMPVCRLAMPLMGSAMHRLAPAPDRAEKRGTTPPGFARAFFEANP